MIHGDESWTCPLELVDVIRLPERFELIRLFNVLVVVVAPRLVGGPADRCLVVDWWWVSKRGDLDTWGTAADLLLYSNVFDLLRRANVEWCCCHFGTVVGSDSVEKLAFRSYTTRTDVLISSPLAFLWWFTCSNLFRRRRARLDQDFITLLDFFDDGWSRS